jgi:hypothetical protein
VTFTATVTANSPGSGTPTGTATFKDGSIVLGTGTLNASAIATSSTSALGAGNHSITAVYNGDASFSASTSTALTETVSQADTTTTVVSSLNPSVYGQAVTFTATVAAVAPGGGTPTGTMTFKDGSTVLGTGTLSSGQAQFTIALLGAGSHPIAAVYNGDASFSASTSTAVTETVNQASTTTRLTASVNPSVHGQSVTFTATVAAVAPGGGTPTGTVTFKDGSTALAPPATLDASGRATFTTATLSGGNHSITAVYNGDSNYRASTSAKLTQKVNGGNTARTLTASPNSSVDGQSVSLTPTDTAASPGARTPTGAVTPRDGSTITGRQHVRLQPHSGIHDPIAAIRQLLDRRRLQRRPPIDKASTSAKLSQTVNA